MLCAAGLWGLIIELYPVVVSSPAAYLTAQSRWRCRTVPWQLGSHAWLIKRRVLGVLPSRDSVIRRRYDANYIKRRPLSSQNIADAENVKALGYQKQPGQNAMDPHVMNVHKRCLLVDAGVLLCCRCSVA